MLPRACFALLLCVCLLAGQTPAPAPEETSSPQALVEAIYRVISGPAGQKRDWDRMRSLFLPGAKMIGTRRTAGSAPVVRVMDVEEYIKLSGPILEERGFYEQPVANTVNAYGTVAHVFSSYETRFGKPDATVQARGINSIQMVRHQNRWWVVSLVWDSESPENPLPDAYRPK